MLIPKLIAEQLTKLTPKLESRYTMQGVLCERTKDGVVLTETNGSQLMQVRYKDVPADYPSVGVDVQPVEGFKTIVPGDTLEKAAKAVPKKTPIPILSNIGISETLNDNGEIQIVTTDLESTQRFAVKPLDGQFPNYAAVIPEYVTMTSKNLDKDFKGSPAVRVSFDAKLLADVLLGVAAIGGHKQNIVEILIPLTDGRPLQIKATNPDIRAEVMGLVCSYKI